MNGKGSKHDFATWCRVCVVLDFRQILKKTSIKEQLYVSSKEHSVEKDKHMMFNVNNNLFLA